MSDFIWYSRLVVWAGMAVLLLQAITGRSSGFLTALAVAALSFGFVAFLVGLALSGRPLALPAEAATESSQIPSSGEAAPSSKVEPFSLPHEQPAQASSMLKDEAAPAIPKDQAPPGVLRPTGSGTVRAVDVTATSPECGAVCPHCDRAVREGQVAVSCFRCGTVHHAACWTEHHFRCAAPGCDAQGGIEAPL
jgi:hypothetical protein